MTVVPTIAEWIVYSDVAIDGRTYASDAPVLMDSGTAGITGYGHTRQPPQKTPSTYLNH